MSTEPTSEQIPAPEALSPAQARIVAHRRGALMVLGAAATGKSEAIARRLAATAGDGIDPASVAIVTACSQAADRLRERAEELIQAPREELVICTWEELCERILREHCEQAGLDPFFEVVGQAERLAMLVDRFERLPLRHHEIRGNPTGLLARLLGRMDALKAAGITAQAVVEGAILEEELAVDDAESEAARREVEFADLFAAHDGLLAEAGCLDRGDLLLTCGRLLAERADVKRSVARRFRHVMVDELEDMSEARCRVLAGLGIEAESVLGALNDDQATLADGIDAAERFDRIFPEAEQIVLEEAFRLGSATLDAARAVLAGSGERIEKPWRAAGGEVPVRFWSCANERAQAQAVAKEVEHLIATGMDPERIAVVVPDPVRHGQAVVSAMGERGVAARVSWAASLFGLPEVRDTIAWLRALADPTDAAAVTRALTRPPVELRSVELAKLSVIARRRKLDMVSACEAAMESPQITPEARERINTFLRLYRGASAALEKRRPDAFVRRLIERVGLRRQRMFAAKPETAERLLGLSRLAEIASAWSRREPHGSTRDFVRYLTALAEAGVEMGGGPEPRTPGTVRIGPAAESKGSEPERVFLLSMGPASESERRDLAKAITSTRSGLVLSRVDAGGRPVGPYEEVLSLLGGIEEIREEELFGPAEDLHSTYGMMRDEVIEASWKAGRELSEPRLDTVVDLNRAVTRYLELLKLAALAQLEEGDADADAIKAINGQLAQIATPDQLAELERSALDAYLLESERERGIRRELIAAREEPSLEAFLPKRGEGLRLSASDIDLYLTCPLKYKFARVFGIPQEPTINQRFGILIHNVLERFHREGEDKGGEARGRSLDYLMWLLETGWRRSGFGKSNDELQFRDRARQAMRTYWEREAASEAEPVWLERKFEFRIGPHHLRGRVDRVDRLPGGGYELIDYKTGLRKSKADLRTDVQLALYRMAAREAWDIEAGTGSYYYVLDGDKVAVEAGPGEAARVERTVMEVGEGVLGQDFEPRPSPEVCSWCDYRLICPAADV